MLKDNCAAVYGGGGGMLAMICAELFNNTIRENVLIDADDHVEREKCRLYFIDATPLRAIGGCQKINNKN